MTRFTLADLEAANESWGCNCGPGALAAILDITLDEVRPLLQGFEDKRYTNPTLMLVGLRASGRRWSSVAVPRDSRSTWPLYGLARIQWEGPWTQPGVPLRARYRYTHWVGAWTDDRRGVGIYDVNAMANGSGWCAFADWERVIAPELAATYKRASGGWHITHAIEVERAMRRAA